MHLDRRAVTAALLALGVRPAWATEPDGLFWRATAPGKAPCTLFGYARVAAAATPDIVADGMRLLDETQRLVLDMPNVRFPSVSIPLDAIPPILGRVSAPTAARLRAVLDTAVPASPARDKMPGIQAVLFLRGEGQANPQPSVGGTIAERAAGKPVATLVTESEIKAAFHPPDLAALDKRVDEPMLIYLLGLRGVVGPLGAFEQGLYARRRTADLASADADMARHGVPSSRDLIPLSTMEPTLIARAVAAVRSTPSPAFFMLPVGTLTQDKGILATLRAGGVHVEVADGLRR